MSWHFLERWIEKANQHSTLVGKFWITFLIVCRMVIVASVGDRVYNDEQSEFKCNTLQPGCTNVCFNAFSPISHLRFWSFQILLVAAPSVVFVIYSAHATKAKKNMLKKLKTSHDDDEDGASEKHAFRTKQSGTSTNNKKLSNVEHFSRNSVSSLKGRSKKRKSKGQNTIPKHQSLSDQHSTYSVSPENAWTTRYLSEDERKYTSTDPAFPLGTIVKLRSSDFQRQLQADSDDKDSYQHFNYPQQNFRLNSNSFSNETGVQDQRLKSHGPQSHRNENRNNNKTNEDRFVWREPTKCNKSSAHVSALSQPEQQERKNLSEVIVWMPTESNDAPQKSKPLDNTHVRQDRGSRSQLFHPSPPLFSYSFPSAPPEYPEAIGYYNGVPPYKAFPEMKYLPEKSRKRSKIQESPEKEREMQKNAKTKPITILPAFAQHFGWYMANVLLRLLIEIFFVVLQLLMFGLSVPEIYKCTRNPCPNIVDCFVSRPMEKTIFLWFMLIYSCICVVLNFAEFTYLFIKYLGKKKKQFSEYRRLRKERKKEKKLFQEQQKNRLGKALAQDWMAGDNSKTDVELKYEEVALVNAAGMPLNMKRGNPIEEKYNGEKKNRFEWKAPQNDINDMQNYDFTDHNQQEYMAVMLDSEDEREGADMDAGRIEQDDLDDLAFDGGAGGLDIVMDVNQDNQNDDDGGL